MTRPKRTFPVLAIGCSWGGLSALSTVLSDLPEDLPAGIVIVQHRRAGHSDLAGLLSDHTSWAVCEAEDKETLAQGRVFLAPPGYHLLMDGDRFALSTEGPVHHSRPSIDVFFESIADSYRHRVIGVVLTGANDDGAVGLAEIVRRGGLGVVQDPATAAKASMPEAALRAVPDAHVVPIDGMGCFLREIVSEREPRPEAGT